MVNSIFKYLIGLAFCVAFLSCKKSLAPLEYKTWIESEESGLRKTKAIGEMEYEMQYQTREYLLLLNKGPKAFEKEIDIESSLEDFSNDIQVLFTIRNLNGIPPLNYNVQNEMEYYARIQYLTSEVTSDFFILNNSMDTVKCLFSHMERDFGITPELRLNLAFGMQKPSEDFQLCFNDRLFNNGMIKFSMSKDDLSDLPELRNN